MSIATLFFLYLKLSSVAAVFLLVAVINTYKRGTNKSFNKKPAKQREKTQYVIYSDLLHTN